MAHALALASGLLPALAEFLPVAFENSVCFEQMTFALHVFGHLALCLLALTFVMIVQSFDLIHKRFTLFEKTLFGTTDS